MKINKILAGRLVEKLNLKRSASKRSRKMGKQQALGHDDAGATPSLTVRDIIHDIPSIKVSQGNITLPAGVDVEGEEALRHYLGELGMAFAWHETEVMQYAEKLDLLFDMPGQAALNFTEQYQSAADEKRYVDDQHQYDEGLLRKIVRESLTGQVSDSIRAQQDSISNEKAELQSRLVKLEDPDAIKKIANRIEQLNNASSELSSIEVEDPADDADGDVTTVEGKISKVELHALIYEAEQELSNLEPVGDTTKVLDDEDIDAYDPMAVAAAQAAIAVLGISPKSRFPPGGVLENEIYTALEEKGLGWDQDRLIELGDQALSVAGILLGVGSKHF